MGKMSGKLLAEILEVGRHSAEDVGRLSVENAQLRARIAELERVINGAPYPSFDDLLKDAEKAGASVDVRGAREFVHFGGACGTASGGLGHLGAGSGGAK